MIIHKNSKKKRPTYRSPERQIHWFHSHYRIAQTAGTWPTQPVSTFRAVPNIQNSWTYDFWFFTFDFSCQTGEKFSDLLCERD
jgi:hypothetical protein